MRRCVWIIVGLVLAIVPGSACAAAPGIEVKKRTQGDTVTLDLYNPHLCELTVALELTLTNMTATPPGPVRVVCPPQSTIKGTVLKATNANQNWRWNYSYNYIWGSTQAKFDPNVNYLLPYALGSSFRIMQGHNGKTSHFGNTRFAIDFDVPRLTPIHAARAGKVVLTQDGFDEGKLEPSYKEKANFVYIRHADATLAEYVHLTKGTLRVKIGDMVQAGQLVGLSGNSGYSTGPHLHFMVFRARDAKNQESLPVRFLTREGPGLIPEQGRTYTAVRPSTKK